MIAVLPRKRQTFDFRTILYLNILLMLFLIVSGSEAVLLCSFALSAAVLVDTGAWRQAVKYGVGLSIVVMIRYLPAMMADFRVILEAMRLRGVPISLKFVVLHPMKAMEYLIVPMLFRSEKITEEFSGAALVKGYASGARRTSYFDVRLAAKDAAMLAASTASLVLCAFV